MRTLKPKENLNGCFFFPRRFGLLFFIFFFFIIILISIISISFGARSAGQSRLVVAVAAVAAAAWGRSLASLIEKKCRKTASSICSIFFSRPPPPRPSPPSPNPSNSNKFRSLQIWSFCCWILAFAAAISSIKNGVETGGGGGGGEARRRHSAQREQKLGHKKGCYMGHPDRVRHLRSGKNQKHCLQES